MWSAFFLTLCPKRNKAVANDVELGGTVVGSAQQDVSLVRSVTPNIQISRTGIKGEGTV